MVQKEIQTINVCGYTIAGGGRTVDWSIYNTYRKMHIVGANLVCCAESSGVQFCDADFLLTKGAGANAWTGGGSALLDPPVSGRLLMNHLQCRGVNTNATYADMDLPEGCSIEVDVGETLSFIYWDVGDFKTQYSLMIYFYYE